MIEPQESVPVHKLSYYYFFSKKQGLTLQSYELSINLPQYTTYEITQSRQNILWRLSITTQWKGGTYYPMERELGRLAQQATIELCCQTKQSRS